MATVEEENMERTMEDVAAGYPRQGMAGISGGRRGEGTGAKKVDWFRFWRNMVIAVAAFNVVAGLVTWYYIFPLFGLR